MKHLHSAEMPIGRAQKESRLGQRGGMVWLYGLSGAGKSTLAGELEAQLSAEGRHTVVLDGDNLRRGLSIDLGFSDVDRTENLRRAAEVARLFAHSGAVTICAFITPRRAHRTMIRSILGADDLLEVYLSARVEECAKRDPKGLYAKARSGGLAQFTGVGAEFEPPGAGESPLVVDTAAGSVADCIGQVLAQLRPRIKLQR